MGWRLPLGAIGPVDAIHLIANEPERTGVGLGCRYNRRLIGLVDIVKRRGVGANFIISVVPGAASQFLMHPDHLGIFDVIRAFRRHAHAPIKIPTGAQLTRLWVTA